MAQTEETLGSGRSDLAERLQARWAGMSGKLGMGFAAVGFIFILFAWNGAAELDYTQGQIPYLISGGLTGLGLIFIGAILLLVENQRRDRQKLETRLDDLLTVLGKMSAGASAARSGAAQAGLVAAGRSSYHDPSCHMVEGRDMDLIPVTAAQAQDLTPCRVCSP